MNESTCQYANQVIKDESKKNFARGKIRRCDGDFAGLLSKKTDVFEVYQERLPEWDDRGTDILATVREIV